MLKERLNQLFTTYDHAIQSLIAEVLILEQANISLERPHLKEYIDQIISRLANKELDRTDIIKDQELFNEI